MATKAVKFEIDLRANPAAARQLETALKRVGATGKRAASDMDRGFKGLNNTMRGLGAAIVALGIGRAVRSIVSATVQQENALRQLDARLKSTRGAAGLAREELVKMAGAMQQATTFGDELVIETQGLLLTFTKIGKEVFPQALEAVLNMSVALDQDLKSSAIQVGKALNDPILGITAMSRAGIQFSEDQRKMIRALVETGRIADAQRVILAELETQFGGAARAAKDTLGGSLQSLKNAFGDLLEGDSSGGGVRGATQAINDLTETLSDPQIKSGFQTVINGLGFVATKAVEATAAIGNLISRYTEWLANKGFAPADDTRSLEQLEARRDKLQKALRDTRRGTIRGLIFGDSTREKLKAELDEVYGLIKGFQFRNVQGGSASTYDPRPPAGTNGAKPKKPATPRDLFGPQEESLRRQLALLGQNTEASRILFEVQHGALQSLQPQQKQVLLDLATELDLAKQRADAVAKEAEDRKKAEAEALELKEALITAEGRYMQYVERVNELQRMGLLTDAERVALIEKAAKRLAEETKKAATDFEEFGVQAARNLQTAFADFLFDPFEDGVKGMLKNFVDVIRRMAAEAAASGILKSLGSSAKEAAGSGSGWWPQVLNGFAGAFGGGSAQGNAFAGGRMIPFANGGVIKGPMTFPMANGQFGLMGEAGPEAIMPLRRGPGGRLGVDASAGRQQAPEINIRQIMVADPAQLADYIFSAQNERVIVQYLDRLGFGARR